MRRTLSIWSLQSLPLALFALSACAGSPDTVPDLSEVDDGAVRPALPDLAAAEDLSAPPVPRVCAPTATIKLPLPVAELSASKPFAFEVTVTDAGGPPGPHPLKVVLEQADGTPLKTLLDAASPLGAVAVGFTPAAEKALPTGALRIKAEVGCPMDTMGMSTDATATLYVVRLGATKLFVKNGDGGGRVALMYHALDHRTGNYFPIPESLATSSLAIPMGEAELDEADGTPRRFPDKPWADRETPPVDGTGAVLETGHTLPVSLKLGTRPDLEFVIGKTARGSGKPQATGLVTSGLPPIRLVVDGIAGSDTALVSEGGKATVRLDPTPVPAIDRVDKTIAWHFETPDAAGQYQRITGGEQSVMLRFYGVLGNEQGTMSPDLPWVAVVDEATAKIAGGVTDAAKARALLVQHVYEDSALTYDRKSGASKYTRYSGSGGWSVGTFSLGEYLKRSRGKVVNCSDCASILSTYANMIGAKLHYAIIGWNFKLNPILGIGAMSFGSPFDSGRLQFSYHAVTTPDATMTVDDATLAVDGDMDPTMAPHTKRLVQELSGSDYLTRLSPTFGTGTPDYTYDDQITHAR